ncbi:MAG: hypothetical protein OES12_11150, partial [Anaerolineae bacterium]|nr:hypothetical protein [Anaerolineae bacterium]
VQEEDAGGDWWSRLFSPEKTMDLAMAGMASYGEAGMAKEDREYPEKVAQRNEAEWQKMHGGSGMLSMGRNYPSTR